MQAGTESQKPARKRGRPSTGKALSASDRQARRFAKLEAEGKALLPAVIVSKDVRMAITKLIEFKDMTLGNAVDRIVRDRLLRKRLGKRITKREHAKPLCLEFEAVAAAVALAATTVQRLIREGEFPRPRQLPADMLSGWFGKFKNGQRRVPFLICFRQRIHHEMHNSSYH